MRAYTRRDLTIVPITRQKKLVIACDSCGAIGVKEEDVFKLSPRFAGKFTARVALTEVMCSGALPVMITNGVACEMNPTGKETILGVKDELINAGISDIVLAGSTEENFKTSMTALAITVVGIAKESDLKFISAVNGDRLILFGSPSVGAEVDLESIGFYEQIKRLLPLPEVKEIVPVGSGGVAYEANILASLNGMRFKPYKTEIDYSKSAGPVTCLLILCAKSTVDRVLNIYPSGIIIGEVQLIGS